MKTECVCWSESTTRIELREGSSPTFLKPSDPPPGPSWKEIEGTLRYQVAKPVVTLLD